MFPSSDLYVMLLNQGFSYTLLVEVTSVDGVGMQQHTIKSLNHNNKSIDLSLFHKSELSIQACSAITFFGEFTDKAFVLPKKIINGHVYWYANFKLNNTTRILSFSCDSKAPLSNFIDIIRKNAILSFENYQLKIKIDTSNNEIKQLRLKALSQSGNFGNVKDKNSLLTHFLPTNDEIKNEYISNDSQFLSTSTYEKKVVDFSLLVDFLSDDRKTQNEFLQMFTMSLPAIISEINAGYNSQNIEPIKFNLHKLKSSVKAIGAEKCLATLVQMEALLAQADWPAIYQSIENLKANLDGIERRINTHFINGNNQLSNHDYSIGSNVSVLVIDDDVLMIEYVKALLNKVNVQNVQTADQGALALKILRDNENAVDIIFCDLEMPEMDGVSLLRHLSDIGYTGGIIIHSSAETSVLSAVSNLALAHGLNILASVQKPISKNKVLMLFEKMTLIANKNNSKRVVSHHQSIAISASALRDAIAKNQLVAYYQPKISIRDKSVVGFEALARWVDPVNGIISPALFIPLAESEGLIADLTMVIFNQATNQLKKWLRTNPKLKMAVNFSMHSLDNLDLPQALNKQIQDLNISAKNIIIEVTESGLTGNMVASTEVLTRLKILGFSLSIDDFGTGYSSMNQLKTLPFSELKLDYSFVHGAGKNMKSKAILKSSIHLAKNLHLTTVAEGVETQEDWDLVKVLDCDTAQGFLISKPMDSVIATQWLHDWKF